MCASVEPLNNDPPLNQCPFNACYLVADVECPKAEGFDTGLNRRQQVDALEFALAGITGRSCPVPVGRGCHGQSVS